MIACRLCFAIQSRDDIRYALASNASEFRVEESNILMAAADSGLFGVIAPTDEEFTVVDADDGRFPPSSQIILLVKARC
jgi:hypothetical protein